MKRTLLYFSVATILILNQSCKDETKDYDVPTTYDFTNVDYSGQTTRLGMMTELIDTIKKANTAGVQLSATQLKNMYANSGNPFGNSAYNSSGKQLKDKTFSADRSTVDNYLEQTAATSLLNQTGSNGTAGLVTSGTSKRLMDANGKEYKEMIEKTLMGALIYYQITEHYLGDDQIGSSVALADRQHHWDEAFGYFGLPTDYNAAISATSTMKYVGKYSHERDALTGVATNAYKAFIIGRAAINNGDDETVTAQVTIIRDNIEKGLAATAIHYINGAITAISDDGSRNHQLSEGYFLVKALKYNPTKKITDAQLAELDAFFGTNFYNATSGNLTAAKNLLSTIYGFDSVKDQL